MRTTSWITLLAAVAGGAGCGGGAPEPASRWHLAEGAAAVDEDLARRMFRALDEAERAGTDPGISSFHVRAATVIEHEGEEHVVLGGNSEYQIPEAIHAETSLLNHAITLFGPEVARRAVRFIAFYGERCGDSLSCGDCRDYQIATTDWERLLVACGQASDGTVRVRRFRDAVVPEESFTEVSADELPLERAELDRLVRAARAAREGGVSLFTAERHLGAAGITFGGRLYRAAGADDAAFHYRYPIGGLLQQAATERDVFVRAIVVAGTPGEWPRVSYRDRQYGYEASSFNLRRGREPIRLILTDGEGRFRATTFEEALPYAFSTARFMPGAVDRFLERITR